MIKVIILFVLISSITSSSPRNFLENLPSGVYTVIPIRNNCALDLPFHLNRLHNSASQLSATSLGPAKADLAWKLLSSLTGTGISGIVTVLLSETSKWTDIYYYYTNLDAESLAQVESRTVLVDLYPYIRQYPTSKRSIWTIERKSIEAKRSISAYETIMYSKKSSDIILSEGLITSFGVVERGSVILLPPQENVLPGSMTRLVIEICRRKNIPILFKDIRLSDSSTWTGAFLTSCTKQIVAVKGINLPAEVIDSDGSLPDKIILFETVDPLIVEIRMELYKWIYQKDADILMTGAVNEIAYPLWWSLDENVISLAVVERLLQAS